MSLQFQHNLSGKLIFCTLFDSAYLSRGLVMYQSLRLTKVDFHLYIFAFDDLCYKILNDMSLANVTLISLKSFETEDLLEVKPSRSKAEYCWTCTSSTIEYILTKYNEPSCTYIDADLFFFSSPEILNNEIKGIKNVLITEHRYSRLSSFFELKRSGRFCVQYITFSNDSSSRIVLDTWKKQCLNWCFARFEDGKFGDQKYLDDWPVIYNNIHILKHQGGGLAPWNIQQYAFEIKNTILTGKVKKTGLPFDVVFYHFQYVKLLSDGSYDIGWYFISSAIKKLFYEPYLLKIEVIEKRIKKQNSAYKTGITYFKSDNLKSIVKTNFKRIFGYNILKLQH